MSPDAPSTDADSTDADSPPLPEVLEGALDEERLLALLRDVEACGERLQIVPKRGGPRTRVPDGEALSLSAARAQLLAGELRGVQLRYLHLGQEWWDTILSLGSGRYRLVRIQHPA